MKFYAQREPNQHVRRGEGNQIFQLGRNFISKVAVVLRAYRGRPPMTYQDDPNLNRPTPDDEPNYLPWTIGGAAILAVILGIILLPGRAGKDSTVANNASPPTATKMARHRPRRRLPPRAVPCRQHRPLADRRRGGAHRPLRCAVRSRLGQKETFRLLAGACILLVPPIAAAQSGHAF